MNQSILSDLAKFAVQTRFSEIPDEVAQFTKCLTLKTIAGTFAGAAKKSGKDLSTFFKERRLPEEAGIVGSGFKTGVWEAVFLQTFLGHARELEDDRIKGGVSWDITVVPIVLSLAEKYRLSGKALLESLILGLEVHARTCYFGSGHLGIQIVPPAVGPAAAAARTMGLDAATITTAMGHAMSGVSLAIVNFGSDAHYFESAMQSLQGIMAADMAKLGLTSNPDLATYLSNYLGKEQVVPEKIVEGLGEKWLLSEILVKKYPCCFVTHRHLDALRDIIREEKLSYDQIDAVDIHISQYDQVICDRPDPKTEGDLQFSYQHLAAAVMLDGDVDIEHVCEEIVPDRRLREARSKVKMIVHPDWSNVVMECPAGITLRTKDGREFSKEHMHVLGSPEQPLSVDQFRSLYSKFTKGIVSERQIKHTADAILDLENLSPCDVQDLMDILVFRFQE